MQLCTAQDIVVKVPFTTFRLAPSENTVQIYGLPLTAAQNLGRTTSQRPGLSALKCAPGDGIFVPEKCPVRGI